MRKVIIDKNDTPPQNWIDEADIITQQLIDAPDEGARKIIMDRKEGFWRDDRVRDWLLTKFANKCWYTEAEESVSSIHVDHFRPKGRITNLDKSRERGYWWLSFNWRNYVISGQLINVKKSDFFPLVEGVRGRECCSYQELELEAPVLISPLTDDARLISFDLDDSGCIAVPAGGIDDVEKLRVDHTVDILGLNRLPRLNEKRRKLWNECKMAIKEYQQASRGCMLALAKVKKASVIKRLKEKVQYEAEFSSVASACIRKNAPEPVVASVFE